MVVKAAQEARRSQAAASGLEFRFQHLSAGQRQRCFELGDFGCAGTPTLLEGTPRCHEIRSGGLLPGRWQGILRP